MINYKILHDAQEYYQSSGFNFVETPWTVPHEIATLTYDMKKEDNEFYLPHKDKTLVASGEQGFLSLYNKGFLPKGKFQTITPCFRNETFDETHTKYFIKNELINTENVTGDGLWEMLQQALEFFNRWVKTPQKLHVKYLTENSIDIEYDGIEIGSYGIRECSFLKWIYGTGVAEPRFSRITNEI